MKPSPCIGPRHVVYRNPHHHVYAVTADFGAFSKEYFVTEYGTRAGLVIVKDRSILLVRQYRMLLNRLSWEIPGGKVEEGETPELAAIREGIEEAGLRCGNVRPLISYEPGMDSLHNPTKVFFATEFVQVDSPLRDDEVVERAWLPLERCIAMIFDQEIVEALSVLSLLAYQVKSTTHA